MTDDLVIGYVELFEYRLIEQPALVGTALPVQLLGVRQEAEGSLKECCTSLQALVGEVQLSPDLVPLGRNGIEPGPDLGGRYIAPGCQIQEILFLPFEAIKLRLELLTEQFGGSVIVSKHFGNVLADEGGDISWELQRCVVTENGIFDLFHVHVAAVADMVLAPSAKEVEVDPSSPADGSIYDDSGLPPLVMALSAPQAAL